MSAISGLLNFNQQPVQCRDLDRMNQALIPYGRDSSGCWNSGCIGLTHRLMRVTPEDVMERQPLSDDGLVLVGDLRIDNREDLGRKLGYAAGELRRLSDSSIVLRSYKKWDTDCVKHLIGAFAFAVWNASSRTLFLARDQRGWKSLFFYNSSRCFAFASMPKGLFALSFIPRELNEAKVAEFLTLNHRNHMETLYKGICRLPPAHCMVVTQGGHRIERYWNLDPTRRVRLKSDDEYVERAEELLDEVVRASLRSASPVGAMMSGGLDSSAVACVAGKQLAALGKRFSVFTEVPREGFYGAVPSGRYADETPLVEAIHELNPMLDLNFVRSEGLSLFDGLNRRYTLFESPQRNALNHLWIDEINRRASEQGIRVLLGGQSGNMSLSYNGLWYLPELFRRGSWGQLFSELMALSKSPAYTMGSLIKGKVLAPLLPEWVWQRYLSWKNSKQGAWSAYSAINPTFADSIGVDARNEEVGHDSSYRLPPDGREARILALSGGDFKGEYQSMLAAAFGTEIRDPLGDIRLLEYSLAIPQDQYLKNGQTRWLLRRLMKGTLPPEVLDNNQRGFQMADWHERLTGAKGQIETELNSLLQSETASRMLDLARLQDLVKSWPNDGWGKKETIANYRLLLSRGIVVGRFIRWFEGDNL